MPETITSRDAARFPIVASCTLLGLYLFFKVSKLLWKGGGGAEKGGGGDLLIRYIIWLVPLGRGNWGGGVQLDRCQKPAPPILILDRRAKHRQFEHCGSQTVRADSVKGVAGFT